MFYYIALGMQLVGFTLVGLCLILGIKTGDYNKVQLSQFVGGMCLFYIGQLLKVRLS